MTVLASELYAPSGRLRAVSDARLVASLPGAFVGEVCEVRDRDATLEAEVVALRPEGVVLSVLGDVAGLSECAEIRRARRRAMVGAGPGLVGRVIDGCGRLLDGAGPLEGSTVQVPLRRSAPPPMERPLVSEPFATGIRVIDGCLTLARGQRIGIFGEAGAGKSSLLGALVRGSSAEICVVALVGERGREVGEFVARTLGPEAMASSVVVAATSDRPAMERIRAAECATAIAEHFRSCGHHVLLVVDSLTRHARAQRDVGLSAGETPVRRGFPPSVFAGLPCLLERAGLSGSGSITAIYTVLTEGDGDDDPIADEVRGILDGHLQLSPELARRGHYPAIDVTRSKSRLMAEVAAPGHAAAAGEIAADLAMREELEFLRRVGELQPGRDPTADRALERMPGIDAFLRQPLHEASDFEETVVALEGLVR
ncbi:FliI/YscN family ATPase [Jannaschia sp. LMIT008]|uniref:FliI/YscN family ATPase n=1 Tax=Jannaschia maritima TaxID=3032585 RepID=UPI0028119897|nr:FliI/YscN family ATPase [Jannaschia sp. LMIT008]